MDLDRIRKLLQKPEGLDALVEANRIRGGTKQTRRIDRNKMETKRDRLYKLSADGRDAMLKFGKYSGRTLSDLVRQSDGREYLRWMLGRSYPTELLDVVTYVLAGYSTRS